MPRRSNARKPLSVHVPLELYEWIEAEAERRDVSRSKLVYAAIEVYRLLSGVGIASNLLHGVREEIPPPERARTTKLQNYLAVRRLNGSDRVPSD